MCCSVQVLECSQTWLQMRPLQTTYETRSKRTKRISLLVYSTSITRNVLALRRGPFLLGEHTVVFGCWNSCDSLLRYLFAKVIAVNSGRCISMNTSHYEPAFVPFRPCFLFLSDRLSVFLHRSDQQTRIDPHRPKLPTVLQSFAAVDFAAKRGLCGAHAVHCLPVLEMGHWLFSGGACFFLQMNMSMT